MEPSIAQHPRLVSTTRLLDSPTAPALARSCNGVIQCHHRRTAWQGSGAERKKAVKSDPGGITQNLWSWGTPYGVGIRLNGSLCGIPLLTPTRIVHPRPVRQVVVACAHSPGTLSLTSAPRTAACTMRSTPAEPNHQKALGLPPRTCYPLIRPSPNSSSSCSTSIPPNSHHMHSMASLNTVFPSRTIQ